MPTFHPAYLLRTPASKRQSWLDLLAIDKRLKELGVAIQLLPQEELLVALGVVVERAEELVAAPLVERPRLEGMRIEMAEWQPCSRA